MNRSSIFWITFNPSDIATAKQYMDSLKGDNTVDVLGLTRAMEAVSDILFPATSTLHKRIRYQVFVPAIILSIYRSKQRVKPEYELSRLEYQLQKTLINSGEKYSVFGSSRGEALKYWPSTIYWASLNKLELWGKDYLGRNEAFDVIEERNQPESPNDEGDTESVSREIQVTEGFDELYKRIFPKGRMAERLEFALDSNEAKFFQARFLSLFPNSITSYLLRYGNRKDCERQLFDLECPNNPELYYLLDQGRTYAQISMGAYYAYRWALCRERRQAGRLSHDGEEINAEHFGTWLANNQKNAKAWKFSNLTQALSILGGVTSEKGESKFVDEFLYCISQGGTPKQQLLVLDPVMRRREEDVKGKNRSHFNNSELQAPKNTLGGDEYKDFYFDYRWQQGKTNLKDIFTGLHRR
jgi:hypothetical protein